MDCKQWIIWINITKANIRMLWFVCHSVKLSGASVDIRKVPDKELSLFIFPCLINPFVKLVLSNMFDYVTTHIRTRTHSLKVYCICRFLPEISLLKHSLWGICSCMFWTDFSGASANMPSSWKEQQLRSHYHYLLAKSLCIRVLQVCMLMLQITDCGGQTVLIRTKIKRC